MGAGSSSYDVARNSSGKASKKSRAAAGIVAGRPSDDVEGSDARVEKLARLMTTHKKKKRYNVSSAFSNDRNEDEHDDGYQVIHF